MSNSEFQLESVHPCPGGVRIRGVANGTNFVREFTRKEALLRAKAAAAMAAVQIDDPKLHEQLLSQVEQLLEAADKSRRLDGLGGYQSEAFKRLMMMAQHRKRRSN